MFEWFKTLLYLYRYTKLTQYDNRSIQSDIIHMQQVYYIHLISKYKTHNVKQLATSTQLRSTKICQPIWDTLNQRSASKGDRCSRVFQECYTMVLHNGSRLHQTGRVYVVSIGVTLTFLAAITFHARAGRLVLCLFVPAIKLHTAGNAHSAYINRRTMSHVTPVINKTN